MDLNNPVIQLCIQGTQAEFAHRPQEACRLYRQAWEQARDGYEACIAAHYLARCQENPQDRLHWNQVALAQAEAVPAERVAEFLPSLYLSLGSAHERVGNAAEAGRYYGLAAELGFPHQA